MRGWRRGFWIPAYAGMTVGGLKWQVIYKGGLAVVGVWIPAFAGMTVLGAASVRPELVAGWTDAGLAAGVLDSGLRRNDGGGLKWRVIYKGAVAVAGVWIPAFAGMTVGAGRRPPNS